jgi:hypothetical protein
LQVSENNALPDRELEVALGSSPFFSASRVSCEKAITLVIQRLQDFAEGLALMLLVPSYENETNSG